MLKKILLIGSILFLSLTIELNAKSQKSSKKSVKTHVIKDKTCHDINTLLQDLNDILIEHKNTYSIQDFLEKNRPFFDKNNPKIKRFNNLMSNFFIGSEKRQAQKELNFIYAFYLCDTIADPDNDQDLVDFVQQNFDQNVSYINSVRHIKDLSFNHTAFYKRIQAIIKSLKKDKIAKHSDLNSELLFSIINKLQSIAYSVKHLGEFKQEKKKQNLHLAAECAKAFIGIF